MTTIEEGSLCFTFPDGWRASAYDKWPYYQNQFRDSCGGSKAVDIVALGPDNRLWLVEAKDYRQHPRTKPIELWDEIARKMRDTLAGLFCAKIEPAHANHGDATNAFGATRLRVILHLEQPATHSKLFPRVFDPEKVRQKLRTMVKPIDAHPLVVELNNLAGVPWQVTSV